MLDLNDYELAVSIGSILAWEPAIEGMVGDIKEPDCCAMEGVFGNDDFDLVHLLGTTTNEGYNIATLLGVKSTTPIKVVEGMIKIAHEQSVRIFTDKTGLPATIDECCWDTMYLRTPDGWVCVDDATTDKEGSRLC